MVLLVDAANVVGSRPDGWWRDRPGAARRLVEQLAAAPDRQVAGRRVGRVVVVLEGAGRQGHDESSGPVEVRHAAASGDDLLAELSGPGVLLVTADRELAGRGRAAGADVCGPRALLDALAADGR